MAEINNKRVEILHALGFCFGTEHYYRNRNKTFNYTDGVKIFCKKVHAYWLLDIVDSVVRTKYEMNEGFIRITLKVKDNHTARITFKKGIYLIYKQEIPFIDCPEGDWNFYYQKNLFFWIGEY